MSKYSLKYNKEDLQINKSGINKLLKHPWYGNIREFQNAIEKAVILSKDPVLNSGDFTLQEATQGKEVEKMEENYDMAHNEMLLVKDALNKFEWNLSRTSRALGINRSTLYDKIKKYEL